MNVKTTLILAAGVALAAVLLVQNTTMPAPSGLHAEFSQECEKSLNAVTDWAIREMERQGHGGTLAQRSTIAARIPIACSCARDKLGTVVADDKWALAGKLTAIKFEAELAARTQNTNVRAHTEDEARAQLKRLMSDNKISMTDIAKLSENIDSTLKACFQQHFNRP